MAHQIIEVREREEIGIDVSKLFAGGHISIDHRIAKKNYISIALRGGQLRISSTRFVGLIPLNEQYSIRIVPRLSLNNLTALIIRGGTVPTVIDGYTRGYAPVFSHSDRALEVCAKTLIISASQIATVGLLKDYIKVKNPPQWRGKLLISDTAKKYRAKGIGYKADFDYRTLSKDIPYNQLIKTALIRILAWGGSKNISADDRNTVRRILAQFQGVNAEPPSLNGVVMSAPRYARQIPGRRLDYEKAIWASYSILQNVLPDLVKEKTVKLDSLIVDMAGAFEGFIREVLREHLARVGVDVEDGNRSDVAEWFFAGGSSGYSVHPDVVIKRNGKPVAILDVKYKPAPKEQDRYELLSFMESYGVSKGGFVCPNISENEIRGRIGETILGKEMFVFRFDISVEDLSAEETVFVEGIRHVFPF